MEKALRFLIVGLVACSTGALMAAGPPNFGPNVAVFNPSMPAAEIQAQIDKVYGVQQSSEFGPARNALLFLPGQYKVDVPIGYYTQILGLGA